MTFTRYLANVIAVVMLVALLSYMGTTTGYEAWVFALLVVILTEVTNIASQHE